MKLIDADALKKSVNDKSTHCLNDWSTIGVLAEVDRQPAIDAVPVVHGKWIAKKDDLFLDRTWACCVCGTWFVLEDGTPEENEYNHCPHCGAKMDLEELACD